MLQQLKKIIRATHESITGSDFRGTGDFSRRLYKRHNLFWDSPDAELIRNKAMQPDLPLDAWKSEVNWQRILSNKYNARLFAQMHGCKVATLYWKGRNLHKLDFEKLPEQFVIRPTIGYSCNLVFLMDKNFNHLDQQLYTHHQLKEIMAEALDQNPYQEFLIEEFLRSEQGEYKIPVDYKIWTFNGNIAAITVINRTSAKGGSSSSYDEHWNTIDDIGKVYELAPYQEPPACLQEMVSAAKKLSKSYEIFVRIDFYATDKGVVFGEFTPTPGRGNGFTPNSDKMLLTYWDRYCPDMV